MVGLELSMILDNDSVSVTIDFKLH